MARGQDLRDQPGPVFLVHVRGGVARDGDDVVDRVWVIVGREHRAGAQVEHGHCEKDGGGQQVYHHLL